MERVEKIKGKETMETLVEYLLNTDIPDIEGHTDYSERASRVYRECEKVILWHDRNGDTGIRNAISKVLNEYAKIYTEMGLHFGLLLKEEMSKFSTDREPEYPNETGMDRTSLQEIGAYIRSGTYCDEIDKNCFTQREKTAYVSLEQELLKHLSDEEMAAVEEILSHFEAVKEEIYFSIGIHAGVKLMLQLTGNKNSDYFKG